MLDFTRVCDCWLDVGRCRCAYPKNNMKYIETSGRTIEQDFKAYHDDNPIIYEYFKRYALEAVNSGRGKTSAKLIINRIRWEQYIKHNTLTAYKINDAFTSRYGRLFAEDFPQYAGYLTFRKLRTL